MIDLLPDAVEKAPRPIQRRSQPEQRCCATLKKCRLHYDTYSPPRGRGLGLPTCCATGAESDLIISTEIETEHTPLDSPTTDRLCMSQGLYTFIVARCFDFGALTVTSQSILPYSPMANSGSRMGTCCS